jgi:hypothetical protein
MAENFNEAFKHTKALHALGVFDAKVANERDIAVMGCIQRFIDFANADNPRFDGPRFRGAATEALR